MTVRWLSTVDVRPKAMEQPFYCVEIRNEYRRLVLISDLQNGSFYNSEKFRLAFVAILVRCIYSYKAAFGIRTLSALSEVVYI